MKAVLNELQCPWDIGDVLLYKEPGGDGSDDTEIIVVDLKPCMKTMCKHIGTCTHLKIEDDEGEYWCGLLDDFEVIL